MCVGVAEMPRVVERSSAWSGGIAACIPEARWSPWHAGSDKHIFAFQGNSSKGWGETESLPNACLLLFVQA